MKILQNEDLCYLRTLGLISVVSYFNFFDFSISVDRLSLYVLSCDFYVFCKRRNLLTILHTQKKEKVKKKTRCGFCLRKARVPDTNSIISRFNVCVNKKKRN